MILPTKHIPTQRSMLGLGSVLLSNLLEPTTSSTLWDSVRSHTEIGTYSRFILALDLLYIIGAIELRNGLISRVEPA